MEEATRHSFLFVYLKEISPCKDARFTTVSLKP